jgi:hypothetical protein
MTPQTILKNKKPLYLSDHFKGDMVKAGFKIIQVFLNLHGYVPGFPDVLIITKASKAKQFRDQHKKLKNYRHFNLVVLPSNLCQHVGEPDVVWVDDVNLLQLDVDMVLRRTQHLKNCRFIHSGKRPRSNKMQLVVDTREQKPLWKGKECKRLTMDCGDYTTEKLFGKFHIERKSLEDLYGTILKGHVRFRDEHVRALSADIKLALYIEGTKKDFGAKKFKGGHKRLTKGSVLVKIIDSIEARWGLEIVWCGSRLKAKKMIYERLQKEERRLP